MRSPKGLLVNNQMLSMYSTLVVMMLNCAKIVHHIRSNFSVFIATMINFWMILIVVVLGVLFDLAVSKLDQNVDLSQLALRWSTYTGLIFAIALPAYFDWILANFIHRCLF